MRTRNKGSYHYDMGELTCLNKVSLISIYMSQIYDCEKQEVKFEKKKKNRTRHDNLYVWEKPNFISIDKNDSYTEGEYWITFGQSFLFTSYYLDFFKRAANYI